jgi:hypothetical protein
MAKPTGRGVNPVRFFGFWPKPGTVTGVPRFLVLGNRNPGKTGVPVTGGSGFTRSGNRFKKKKKKKNKTF